MSSIQTNGTTMDCQKGKILTLNDLIVSSADAALDLQRDDGSMPSGHNGPYCDPETPVRNTAHWAVTFARASEISGDGRFIHAIQKAATYLCSQESRPEGFTFLHRTNPVKDKCNGLIGQAWTIEALATSANVLKKPELANIGTQVFLLHPFDQDLGLWRRVDTDGSILGFDATLNHQIWFASSASLLSGEDLLQSRIGIFLDRLSENMSLYPSGVIQHSVTSDKITPRQTKGLKLRVKSMIRGLAYGNKRRGSVYQKAIGYHSFNLYALALLKKTMPDHGFWETGLIAKALDYVYSSEFVTSLEKNKYGYPYNPPGFEVAFALSGFRDYYASDTDSDVKQWVSAQFRRCYDSESQMMSLDTNDPVTLAARLYEATRLPEMTLTI